MPFQSTIRCNHFIWSCFVMMLPLPATSTLSAQQTTPRYEWDGIPIPAEAGKGKRWVLQEHVSDDFTYEAPPSDKGRRFAERWADSYHNAWTGPGRTLWNPANVVVANGNLEISASRAPDSEKIHLGCVTSKQRVTYPLFVETRAKVSNSVLACAVWLLSPDDTQEIDILEAYGASFSQATGKDQEYFAKRMHLSHHVFVRQPFQDYQPTDPGSWHQDGTLWRESFRRVGVFWRDPWNLEYFIDGKLVRTVSGREMIDPKGFTQGAGLNKAMDIIINAEDQTWRTERGLTPTHEELRRKQDHVFKVDWIRVYKPYAAGEQK